MTLAARLWSPLLLWARSEPIRAEPAVVVVAADVDADAVVSELFHAEGASLVRLARLFTDDRNAAEDLVQEAFIRLHRNVHKIRNRAKAAPYLRSIVLNLARDHNRRGLVSLRHREAMTPEVAPEAPEDQVVVGENREEVIAALRSLPGRQRDCLVLRFYLELTEVQIADTLGISKNSVKTHCRRGMAALETRLEGSR